MKTIKIMLIVAACALLCTGCGKIEGYELKKVVDQCGGADKIHSIWVDAWVVKAYCIDGSRAGDW